MENCSICYDSINASTGHCTLSCSHSYHIQCLTKWSSTNPTCPLCRHSLSETEKPEQRPLHDDRVSIRTLMMRSSWNDLDYARPMTLRGLTEPEEDVPSLPPPREGQVFIQPGTNISVYEADVKIVMEQTEATHSEAVRALIRHPEDIVNAIMMIHDYRSRQTHRPRVVPPPTPPRNPLVEPSFDQTMTTALQRMFDEDYNGYKWNSYTDMFWRAHNYTARAENCTHESFQTMFDKDKLEEGYWSA
jgi:hypothetical protein